MEAGHMQQHCSSPHIVKIGLWKCSFTWVQRLIHHQTAKVSKLGSQTDFFCAAKQDHSVFEKKQTNKQTNKQNKTKQNKTKQSKTKNKTKQNKTKQNKTKRNKTKTKQKQNKTKTFTG